MVNVEGELDSASHRSLSNVVAQLVDEGNRKVALDLANLRFTDSTGLSALVESDFRLRQNGGRLALLRPTRIVRKVLAITGMGKHFDIRGSLDSPPQSVTPVPVRTALPPEVWVG